MTKRALVIHHLRTGAPDRATEALAAAGYALDHRYPIEGEALPGPEEGHAVALVHGSLADVTKLDAPGMAEEMRWVEAWWATGRPFFGICHGLQLAAQLLGARVGPPEHGRAEFGYYPLESCDPRAPDGLRMFQWHYYGADLPAGATRLAGSALYPNQIVDFGPGRLGVQGHAEQTAAGRDWFLQADPDGLARPGAQTPEALRRDEAAHGAATERWFDRFFAGWLAEAERLAVQGWDR
jgi:GMP synthase (glutamine-hydrolysing)